VVFSNEIDTDATPLTAFAPGALAELRTQRGVFIGYVCVNPHALICARILSRDEARPVDGVLIERRLRTALALRKRLSSAPYYRWVFGESDRLPGLVLDRYGEVIVGQNRHRRHGGAARRGHRAVGPCWHRRHCSGRTTPRRASSNICRSSPTPPSARSPTRSRSWRGSSRSRRRSLRDRRPVGSTTERQPRALARYVPAGARVLDVCSYVGGWAVTALRHGAASAVCVDASQPALDFAQRNAQRNGAASRCCMAMPSIPSRLWPRRARVFDVVILDPPAFIKRKKDIPQGQAAYRKLNQLALGLLVDEGLLVSCSCSYHLAPAELVSAIQSAARHSGRFVQILEAGGQSPDHPVHPAILKPAI